MPLTSDIKIKTTPFDKAACTKNTWIVLLHANRIPPHVGLMLNGSYNSLTVKGHELDVSSESLFKMVKLKKIESVFIKVVEHPVFSTDYQLAVLQEFIKKHKAVKQFEATCLSPVKEFFLEFYALELKEEELLTGFLGRLADNAYLHSAASLNFTPDTNLLKVPFYNSEQLHERIREERQPFFIED